jgi:alkylation response protein AidB-like acyl-CoA dehydrogenase
MIQDMIADISSDVDAARLLVWRAADLIRRGEPCEAAVHGHCDTSGPAGLFATDALIGEEDLAIRYTVRRYVEDKVKPQLADWYESASIPAHAARAAAGPAQGQR